MNETAFPDHILATHRRVRDILRAIPHTSRQGSWGTIFAEVEAFGCYNEKGILSGLMDFRGDKAIDLPLPRFGPVEPIHRILHRSADRMATIGQCYFIGGEDSAIKIGFSVDVASRLKAIQMCSPVQLRVLAVAPGGSERESAYHAQFAEHRLHGEWFSPAPEILAEIDRINSESAA